MLKIRPALFSLVTASVHEPNPSSRMQVPPFHVAEDGEAIGMLRRFSARFRLTPASVLECLRRHAPTSVLLEAGRGRRQLLAVSADGLRALRDCAPFGDAQRTP
jgi:hypothetical protein